MSLLYIRSGRHGFLMRVPCTGCVTGWQEVCVKFPTEPVAECARKVHVTELHGLSRSLSCLSASVRFDRAAAAAAHQLPCSSCCCLPGVLEPCDPATHMARSLLGYQHRHQSNVANIQQQQQHPNRVQATVLSDCVCIQEEQAASCCGHHSKESQHLHASMLRNASLCLHVMMHICIKAASRQTCEQTHLLQQQKQAINSCYRSWTVAVSRISAR